MSEYLQIRDVKREHGMGGVRTGGEPLRRATHSNLIYQGFENASSE